ncbi:MAG: sulfur-oxidizing protein SoxZ [Campylobacterota bacterium]|nr:sulfur-oxidizing protein SoxZ [Campylobacterota bacterium]
MRIKAKIKGDVVQVKVMAKHDMLTYDQAKKKGAEANFITHINAKVNDKVVYDASTSQFLSKDPLFQFKFKASAAKAGDKLEVTWVDLKGKTETDSKEIK